MNQEKGELERMNSQHEKRTPRKLTPRGCPRPFRKLRYMVRLDDCSQFQGFKSASYVGISASELRTALDGNVIVSKIDEFVRILQTLHLGADGSSIPCTDNLSGSAMTMFPVFQSSSGLSSSDSLSVRSSSWGSAFPLLMNSSTSPSTTSSIGIPLLSMQHSNTVKKDLDFILPSFSSISNVENVLEENRFVLPKFNFSFGIQGLYTSFVDSSKLGNLSLPASTDTSSYPTIHAFSTPSNHLTCPATSPPFRSPHANLACGRPDVSIGNLHPPIQHSLNFIPHLFSNGSLIAQFPSSFPQNTSAPNCNHDSGITAPSSISQLGQPSIGIYPQNSSLASPINAPAAVKLENDSQTLPSLHSPSSTVSAIERGFSLVPRMESQSSCSSETKLPSLPPTSSFRRHLPSRSSIGLNDIIPATLRNNLAVPFRGLHDEIRSAMQTTNIAERPQLHTLLSNGTGMVILCDSSGKVLWYLPPAICNDPILQSLFSEIVNGIRIFEIPSLTHTCLCKYLRDALQSSSSSFALDIRGLMLNSTANWSGTFDVRMMILPGSNYVFTFSRSQ